MCIVLCCCLLSSSSSLLVLNDFLSPQTLQQVVVTGQPSPTSTSKLPLIPAISYVVDIDDFTALSSSLVPPVPTRLIDEIEAGNFVDVSEFCSDHMHGSFKQ